MSSLCIVCIREACFGLLHGQKNMMTLFFVAKKNGRLRLVFDCRAINERFREPFPMLFAAGSSWSQVKIPEGEHLHVANIKDYFYSFSLPLEL